MGVNHLPVNRRKKASGERNITPQKVGVKDAAKHRANSVREALADLQQMMTTTVPETKGGRHTYSVDDCLAGLGFNPTQKQLATKLTLDVVSESASMFTATKKMMQAGINRFQAAELLRRAQEMKKTQAVRKADDGGKAPSGFVGFLSKMGGLRKPKAGGGYDYWYPGQGVTGEPHADEHPKHHDHHKKMTPDPEVAAAYAKLHEKMKAAGFPPIEGGDGKEYKPTSSTKMSHIKDMEEHFEHGLAHHKESEGDSEEGSGDSDNVDVQPSLEDSSDEDDTGDEESSEKEDSSEDDDPADDEVGEPWGYLNDLEYDDEGEPVGDDKPESKEEVAQLQKQVDQLTDALVQMEDRMEKHHQEMYKLLQQNSQQARKSPTKQRLARLFQQVGAFLNLVLGAAIGAAIGGPGGAIAGAWIAHQRNQIKRYRKQSQTRKSLIPVSTNTPTLVKGGVYYCPMTDRLVVPMTTSTGGSKLVKAKYHRRFKRNNKWRYEYTDPKKRTAAQTKKVKAATTKAEKVLKSPTKRKKMVDRFLKELTPTQLTSRLADAAKTEAKEFKEAAIGASMFLHSPPPLKAHQSSMFKVALTGVVAAMAIPAGPIAVLGSLGGALAVHVAFKAFTQILTLGVDGTEAAKVISDGLELVGHLMKSSKKGDPKMTEAFVRIVVERAIKILEEDSLSYGDLHMIMSDNRDSLGLTKGLSDDFDLVKAFTTADVHAAADAAGVSWDNNPAFMDRSERLTGKRHLDDMTEQELRAVASNLKKGEKSARRVPPPPSSKPSRARRPVNEYGHRDGLTPGDCLTIRKSHVVGEGSDRVEVYDNGQFMWKGQTYPNGRQLLAAVTKNPNHHLTIRRYFHFGEK